MKGVEMLMGSLGLDPEKLKEGAENIGKLVEQIARDMAEIKAQNNRIEAKLDEVMIARMERRAETETLLHNT